MIAFVIFVVLVFVLVFFTESSWYWRLRRKLDAPPYPGFSFLFAAGAHGGYGIKRDGPTIRVLLGHFGVTFAARDLDAQVGSYVTAVEAARKGPTPTVSVAMAGTWGADEEEFRSKLRKLHDEALRFGRTAAWRFDEAETAKHTEEAEALVEEIAAEWRRLSPPEEVERDAVEPDEDEEEAP